MNILLVYPKFSDPFFSLTNVLKLISRKPQLPPRELLLISVLFPITWETKQIDLNSDKLRKKDILWADYIFVSAKEEQYNSTLKTLRKCDLQGKKVVGSGALFTEFFEDFEHLEHLLLDDIRITIPLFITDLENNKSKRIYRSNPYFEVRRFVEPYYSLGNISEKFSQNMELSHA